MPPVVASPIASHAAPRRMWRRYDGSVPAGNGKSERARSAVAAVDPISGAGASFLRVLQWRAGCYIQGVPMLGSPVKIMSILKVIFIIFEVLLLFNLLIFVHELGHFLAARWRGLKIDRFAIWFGKPIWKKKLNGVEYALGIIPAGGYVALPQMATMEVIEGKGESSGQPLPPISVLDKIIVAVAGPLFSFLLACGFAIVVWIVGRPVNQGDNSTMVGWVD